MTLTHILLPTTLSNSFPLSSNTVQCASMPATPAPVHLQLPCGLVEHTKQSSCVGSLLFGCSCVFQESPHVQQSIFYSLGEFGSVCFLTAVKGRDGNVDVFIHGIVTHSIAIWHHWTKAHHAVCLRANLETETRIDEAK